MAALFFQLRGGFSFLTFVFLQLRICGIEFTSWSVNVKQIKVLLPAELLKSHILNVTVFNWFLRDQSRKCQCRSMRDSWKQAPAVQLLFSRYSLGSPYLERMWAPAYAQTYNHTKKCLTLQYSFNFAENYLISNLGRHFGRTFSKLRGADI